MSLHRFYSFCNMQSWTAVKMASFDVNTANNDLVVKCVNLFTKSFSRDSSVFNAFGVVSGVGEAFVTMTSNHGVNWSYTQGLAE